MSFSKTGKISVVVIIVAVFAIAATSFAGWGRGGGRGWGGNCWGPGAGYGQRGYGGQGYQSNLSEEERAKLNQERQTFFEATSDLREKLYQKELELRSELAKPEPDAKKAAGIQKEISGLKGELDQKRLDHRIKMRKDFPQSGYRGQGYGRGGRGMGRGMYGGGGCWN
ncbi:MAG: periplasmic heavy metal sensor [Desulfobacterales bacterium]|jgi:Spy/CpxP family protein refolding chaperone